MKLKANGTTIETPNIAGMISEIFTAFNIAVGEDQVLLNGEPVTLDTVIDPDEHDEILLEVKSSKIRVIKQVGEYANVEVSYTENMTVSDALNIAMLTAGLQVNTDELTVIDYSVNPAISYPAGLRSEKVKRGAELHLSSFDKYASGAEV